VYGLRDGLIHATVRRHETVTKQLIAARCNVHLQEEDGTTHVGHEKIGKWACFRHEIHGTTSEKVLIGRWEDTQLQASPEEIKSRGKRRGTRPFEKGGEIAPKIIPFIASQKPDEASAVRGRLRTHLVANQNKEHLVCHIRL
jgi:hypothetical protein